MVYFFVFSLSDCGIRLIFLCSRRLEGLLIFLSSFFLIYLFFFRIEYLYVALAVQQLTV